MPEYHPAIANLDSFTNIIQDIMGKANQQVLGNLEILERQSVFQYTPTELRELADRLEQSGQENCKLELIKSTQIDCLVRGPIRLLLGRISGLQKIVQALRLQLTELVVSSGNS